jgi:hypothetical protein
MNRIVRIVVVTVAEISLGRRPTGRRLTSAATALSAKIAQKSKKGLALSCSTCAKSVQ